MNCIKAVDILLPKKKYDLSLWSVIACDQFTSQPDYWQSVEEITKNAVSTYHIVYPEIYIGQNEQERIESINSTMENYLNKRVFRTIDRSFILTERTTREGVRAGLIIGIDLEDYEFEPDNDALIKATEATVKERIPVRVNIRKNAPLELPHIMLLMDDRTCSVIEPLFENRKKLKKLYDFNLMKDGGNIKGYRVKKTNEIIEKIYALLDSNVLYEKYKSDKKFLFAVGDGNHSLATAKACWENIKTELSEDEKLNHPARFALVELANLHSDALKFSPIHRSITGAGEDFLEGLMKLEGSAKGEVLYHGVRMRFKIPESPSEAIKVIQEYIDAYLEKNQNAKVDYIHGDEYLKEVTLQSGGIGIYMPTLPKDELFDYILKHGILPRKSFSMGEAEDKRYYLESRVIV